MEKYIKIRIEEFSSREELAIRDRELLNTAIKATDTSYSPYSTFRVGAAVRLDNGELLIGSNQENAAYPSGLCAERVVMFYAQVKFPGAAIESIAVFAKSEEFKLDSPVTPCGSCRQVMAEHENRHGKKIRIIMGGTNGSVQITDGIGNLLPLSFQLEQLKKK